MGGFSEGGGCDFEENACLERTFDFGDQGRFQLKLYNALVVSGRHLCSEQVIDHGQAYSPMGVKITFRALSLHRAVIFCPSCGARVAFSVNIRNFSAEDLERTLKATGRISPLP